LVEQVAVSEPFASVTHCTHCARREKYCSLIRLDNLLYYKVLAPRSNRDRTSLMDTNVDNRNRRYPLRRTPALLKVQQRVADGYLLSTRHPAGFPPAICFPVRLREPWTESQEVSRVYQCQSEIPSAAGDLIGVSCFCKRRARGRPVRLTSTTARYFSSSPSDSISRWTPCPPAVPLTSGQRDIIPAFGRTCTSKVNIMLGVQAKGASSRLAPRSYHSFSPLSAYSHVTSVHDTVCHAHAEANRMPSGEG